MLNTHAGHADGRSVRRTANTPRATKSARTWHGDGVAVGLFLVMAAMATFVAFAFSSTGNVEAQLENLDAEDHRLFELAWEIRFLDQELTLAASRYIDADEEERVVWRSIYDASAIALDEALAETRALLSPTDLEQLNEIREITDTNDQLIAFETEIFRLSDEGDREGARAILSGDYSARKSLIQHAIEDHFIAQERRMEVQIGAMTRETRTAKAVATFVLAVITLLVAFIARINHRQKQDAWERDGERATDLARQTLQTQIRDGFEMSLTEDEALSTFEAAARHELPTWRTELLLADSSTAHLYRAASTNSDGGEHACSVTTPTDCPAIRRGTTMSFEHEDHYTSCPNLRGRNLDGGTAICMPLKVMGKSIGVSHSLAPAAPGPDDLGRLSQIAQSGGDRLGVLRAFASTRKQAEHDPLTGLHNRRSLEGIAHELDTAGRDYSVAFCDLDRFKLLNDTHGHSTGDRALRLFTQTLTTTLRPSDIPARWGGEEFVVVFPDTEVTGAVDALERVREALALALLDGHIPRFTFSAGVTEATTDFAAATAVADASLLQAKQQGRDRVLRADPAQGIAEISAAAPTRHETAEAQEPTSPV